MVMSKSVLIVDTPESCSECRMNSEESFCHITGKHFWDDKKFDYAKDIAADCPLRPLPLSQVANEYDFESYTNGVSVGWNRCLEKITGEQLWKK